MTIIGNNAGAVVKLDKYTPPVQVQQPTQQQKLASNGMTDIVVSNSKGEEFVYSGKNLLNKGQIDNINVFGEKLKFVKTLDSEGEKGPDMFNAGMLGAMFGSVTAIATSIGVNAIPGIPAPVKLAIVAGSSIAVGAGVTHLYQKGREEVANKTVGQDFSKGVVVELKPGAEKDKKIETAVATGFGAFAGGAFGFFASVGIANTGAVGAGATMIAVPVIGAVAGGALGYFSSKAE